MNATSARTRRTAAVARLGLTCALGTVAVLGVASPAMATTGKPSPESNCIAIWYANQAFGNVGEDTSYFATLAPGEVGNFSSTFAKFHPGKGGTCPVF